MGISRRGRGSEEETPGGGADRASIVVQGEDMMTQLAEAHRSWGLGSAERWELDADTLTAISLRVTRATGFFRGGGTSMPVITFGPVTRTPSDGAPSTFSIDIGG